MTYNYIDKETTGNEWVKPTIKDTRELLRAIIVGYTHECRAIKKYIKDTHGSLQSELLFTLRHDTQPTARAAMLAMRMIKGGTPYAYCIEDNTYHMPDMVMVRSFVETYGDRSVVNDINWDDIECAWRQVVDHNVNLYYDNMDQQLMQVAM